MSIWRRTPSLEQLNVATEGTMMRPLDIVFTEVGPDFLRATMPVDERTRQPYGLLHGGASVTLAETLGSTGASLCIDTDRFLCVGQEINANHLRSAKSGRVTGTARPLPTDVQLAAYRIIQESLTNVARHVGRAQVMVRVTYSEAEVHLEINDDGTAPSGGGSAIGPGSGITGMRERAAALGGDLFAGFRRDGGFRVSARLPVRPGS